MKLYTDNQGRWAGTQADAKKFGEFEQIEVPTDKPTLLKFLNEYQVGAASTISSSSPDVVSAQMEMVQQKARISPIDDINLKAAFDSAGLTRGYLRRVFDKLEGLKEVEKYNEDSSS